MRRLGVVAAVLIAMFAIHSVAVAQEDEPDVAKSKKVAVHAVGTFTLTGEACPTGFTATDECYAIAGTAVKDGKDSVTLTGTLDTNPTSTTSKSKGTCYTIENDSTETVDDTAYDVTFTFAGEACIKENAKKVDIEKVTGASWASTDTSTDAGKGKLSWDVDDVTGTIADKDPLAGSGTIAITGTATVP
ncbi:MAG TPA: hypothetical protein VEJ86_08455 [Candidatus Binataceae bacterium]|nr:hypothetical protein [Candidatus Binataceae bacterium]